MKEKPGERFLLNAARKKYFYHDIQRATYHSAVFKPPPHPVQDEKRTVLRCKMEENVRVWIEHLPGRDLPFSYTRGTNKGVLGAGPEVVPREMGKVLPEAQPISNGVKACSTSN